jgi:hypothetical protein
MQREYAKSLAATLLEAGFVDCTAGSQKSKKDSLHSQPLLHWLQISGNTMIIAISYYDY